MVLWPAIFLFWLMSYHNIPVWIIGTFLLINAEFIHFSLFFVCIIFWINTNEIHVHRKNLWRIRWDIVHYSVQLHLWYNIYILNIFQICAQEIKLKRHKLYSLLFQTPKTAMRLLSMPGWLLIQISTTPAMMFPEQGSSCFLDILPNLKPN